MSARQRHACAAAIKGVVPSRSRHGLRARWCRDAACVEPSGPPVREGSGKGRDKTRRQPQPAAVAASDEHSCVLLLSFSLINGGVSF
eukprot:3701810-Rhodomonas_salina.1